jgi:hypothetical protein
VLEETVMARDDYPIGYRVLALKDGLVVKLQFVHGQRDELVFTDAEAQAYATAILETRETREERSGVVRAGLPPCAGFRWMGQGFGSCDRCGVPYWLHSHEDRLRKTACPADPDPFELVPITAEMADACRKKWGPR